MQRSKPVWDKARPKSAGKPKALSDKQLASFKSRHAKNIAKGPSSAAYWANKVKWAEGGHVELSKMLADYEDADDVRHLVQKFKTGGQPKKDKEPGLMDYLQSVANTVTSLPEAPAAIYNAGKEFVQAIPRAARTAAGYINNTPLTKVGQDVRRGASTVAGGLNTIARQARQNPVGAAKTAASTALDVIPVIGDIKAYGQDVSTAARMRASGDVSGAQNIERMALPLAIASIAPGVGEARMAGKAVRAAEEAADLARPGTKIMKRPASFPVDFGRPKGNLNLRPSIDPVTLKGAEVQDVESLINQLKGRPGVTKEGLERVAAQFEPGERVSLADFGKRLPQSEYSTVDLGLLGDVNQHLMTEARDRVTRNPSEVFGRMAEGLGLSYDDRYNLEDIIHDGVRFADEDLIDHLRSELGADSGRQIQQMLSGMYNDAFEDVVSDTAERLREFKDDLDDYTYRGYQRLVKDPQQSGYFEVGVTHPERGASYKHYPDSKNVISHFRGSFNPGKLLSGYAPRADQQVADSLYDITAKPNSMVIEEIQSDAQKGVPQTGVLHQPHATAFKAAIQHALEGGADTVYLPTAKTIALPRDMEPKDFRSIYDDEIVKYGLNPLREMPGVEVNPIDDMYHEITISPEARERILKGAGQKAPGYADGGLVSTYDEAKVNDLADQIREGIYG